MKKISVYVEGKTVFVNSDGDVVEIKTFDSEEEAEKFIDSIDRAVESRVNALFIGEQSMSDKVKEVQALLKKEPNSKEATALSAALGVLSKLDKK